MWGAIIQAIDHAMERTQKGMSAGIDVVDDADEYLLPKQLIFTKLNLKLVGQFESKDTNYIIWAVRVWKWQEKKFMDVVSKLINQMIVKGHDDYIEYCENLLSNLDGELSQE